MAGSVFVPAFHLFFFIREQGICRVTAQIVFFLAVLFLTILFLAIQKTFYLFNTDIVGNFQVRVENILVSALSCGIDLL